MSHIVREGLGLRSDEEMANRDALMQKLANARDALENAYQNWDTLSAAQKDQVAKNTCRVAAALIRLELRELESGGV